MKYFLSKTKTTNPIFEDQYIYFAGSSFEDRLAGPLTNTIHTTTTSFQEEGNFAFKKKLGESSWFVWHKGQWNQIEIYTL